MSVKRLSAFAAFFAASMFLFSGCGLTTPGEKVRSALAFPLEIAAVSNGASFVMRAEEDGFTAEFSAPDGMKGLRIISRPDGLAAEEGGFARDCGKAGFPIAENLYRALKTAQADVPDAESDGRCDYSIDETAITVYYDSDSGIVTDINTEEAGVRFEYRILSAFRDERTGNGEDRP